MRLSEILGVDVVTESGDDLGYVHDARLVQDGPLLGTWGAALRLHGLIVGPGSIGTRLGLFRSEVRGPALVKLAFRRPHHPPLMVPWSAIVSIDTERIVVRGSAADYGSPDEAQSN